MEFNHKQIIDLRYEFKKKYWLFGAYCWQFKSITISPDLKKFLAKKGVLKGLLKAPKCFDPPRMHIRKIGLALSQIKFDGGSIFEAQGKNYHKIVFTAKPNKPPHSG